MFSRVAPSFVFLIDQAVSACYMPVVQHVHAGGRDKIGHRYFKTDGF